MKPIHHFWFSLIACAAVLSLLVAIADAAAPAEAYGRIPLRFERNQGQADPLARFVARQGRGSVLLTRQGLVVAREGAVVRLRPLGAREVEPVAEQPLVGRSRYIRPEGTLLAPHFGRIRYEEAYPGVDLVYYGDPQRLEHDFVVAPGADPSPIAWQIDGAERLRLDPNGDLLIETAAGALRLLAPVAYQPASERRESVEAAFELTAHNTVSFRLGDYDPARELVIDPVLDYATYLGGGRADTHTSIKVNEAGEAYIVGATRSLDFPVTAEAAQGAYAGGTCGGGSIVGSPCFDVFVAKLNADGSDLLWATYFGGVGNDLPADAALSDSGRLVIAGTTASRNFPTSGDALQSASTDTNTARSDAFVVQLSSEGRLLYSTLLGGSDVDQATGVAIEADGSAAIVGHTTSPDFPTTSNAVQPEKAGDADHSDVFFARLTPRGDALVYSTYLGRPMDERGGDVAVIEAGLYAVSGSTGSAEFPLDAAGATGAPAGGADAFLAFFGDQRYLRAVLIGGSGNEAGGELAVSGASVYMIGSTDSRDLPTTNPSPLPLWKRSRGFLAEFRVNPANPAVASPALLTYVAGTADHLAVDDAGGAWVAGVTSSSSPIFGGPVAPGCVGSLLGRYFQGSLTYSSYAPGLGAIAAGANRTIYSAGTDASGNLRTTAGAFQGESAGRSDVYVAKWTIAEDDEISLTCVEHGASFTPGEVAPGQIVSLFGSGLGRRTAAGLVVAAGRVTTEIDGIRVLFNGEPAPLLFLWWNQINAVVPYGIAGSSEVEIVVVKDGVESEPFVLPVSDAHPGLFTRDSTGSGVGALLNADGSINTADNPAAAGSVVTLFGTGEGSPDRLVADGEVIGDILDNLPRPTLPVTVMIGSQAAEVLYAGAAPELVAGVLQINVRIPAGTPPGLAPVRVTVGGKFSRQSVSVAVE